MTHMILLYSEKVYALTHKKQMVNLSSNLFSSAVSWCFPGHHKKLHIH